MKKLIFSIFLLSTTLLTSCDFLDVVPEGTATTDDIWRTSVQAEKFLYNLYSNIPERYHCQYLPDMYAGGDMITGWYGSTRYFTWKSLVYDDAESASSSYYRLWDPSSSGPTGSKSYEIYNSIRNCYYFLNNIGTVPDITEEDKNHWMGEAYFLIAYYHQTLLEYYGPVVLIKHEIPLNETAESEVYPSRAPYDSCVSFIAEKYRQAIKLLPNKQTGGLYGRATSAAAYGQLARLMLYAASPLVNGNSEFYADFKNPDGTNLINQTYDAEKWKKAMDVAKEAISFCESAGYALYEDANGANKSDAIRGKLNYHSCFVNSADNDRMNGCDEILFGNSSQSTMQYNNKNIAPRILNTKYNASSFRGYVVPTWDAVEMYYSKNGLPMNVDPETKNLNLYSVATGDSTALLNRNREPRFYASIGYDRGLYEINGGTISIHSRYGEPQGMFDNYVNEYYSNNGYFCQKYISQGDTYVLKGNTMAFKKMVYPYLRLAELYLDYAEAEFEYTGSLSSYGLECLNKIRHRAGLPNFETSWAKVGGIPTGDALRQVLHQERTIEFLMEGRRFHDIRRWKVAEETMTAPMYSWTITEKTAAKFYVKTDMKETIGVRKFTTPKNYWLAIPLTEMNKNYNMVQNPGY